MDQDLNTQPSRKPRGEGVPGAPKGPKTWIQENFQGFQGHKRARSRHWDQNQQQKFGMSSPAAFQQEQRGSPTLKNASSPSQELSQRSDRHLPQGCAASTRNDGAIIQQCRSRAPPSGPSAPRPSRSGHRGDLRQECDAMMGEYPATSQLEDGRSSTSAYVTLLREHVVAQSFTSHSPPRYGAPRTEEGDALQRCYTYSPTSRHATVPRHESPAIQQTKTLSPSECGAISGEERAVPQRDHRSSTPAPSRPMEIRHHSSGIHALQVVWQHHAMHISPTQHTRETRDNRWKCQQGSRETLETGRSIQQSSGSKIDMAAASSRSRYTEDWSFLNTILPNYPWETMPTSSIIDPLSRPPPTRREITFGAIAAEALRAGLRFPRLSLEQIGVPLGSAVIAGESDHSGIPHQELDSANAAERNVPTQGKGDRMTEEVTAESMGDCLSRF